MYSDPKQLFSKSIIKISNLYYNGNLDKQWLSCWRLFFFTAPHNGPGFTITFTHHTQ